jgi:hypothetical protein
MSHTFHRFSVLLLTIVCIVSLTTSIPGRTVTEREELDTLLVRYDSAPDGPGRDGLAARIDTIAHQKYAAISRLYWHIDLASAKAAAREQRRPILHLRMLGRLEEDLSCANSRLFRATLYANQDVSRFLRERFVLYWSSERPVPRVTIDYGDGRALVRTTAGNSAHYVLDEHGNVLDVLPGLYSPIAFRHELEGSLALWARVRDKSAGERGRLVVDYHERQVYAAERNWDRLAGAWIPGWRQRQTPNPSETSVAAAQRATVTKASIELRDLRVVARGLAPEALPEDQIETWAVAGQVLYSPGLLQMPASPVGALLPAIRVLDDTSRALVVRLHNAAPPELRATDKDLRAVIARLEQTILADTGLNQLRLRPQISREIVRRGGQVAFQALNDWIYARVFRTPREDEWLGLLQRNVFTGLPGDGVVSRGAR